MMGLSMIVLVVLCGGVLMAVLAAVLVIWMQNRQENAADDTGRAYDDPLPLPGRRGPGIEGSTPPAAGVPDPNLEAQIRALMAAGSKIEAIKVYRAATGAGLAQAKSAVEALERGEPPAAQSSPKNSDPTAVGTDDQIRALLRAGNKLEAIKVYRRATNAGLAEAKNAVEAIQRTLSGFNP